jgi:hypothetical protein
MERVAGRGTRSTPTAQVIMGHNQAPVTYTTEAEVNLLIYIWHERDLHSQHMARDLQLAPN